MDAIVPISHADVTPEIARASGFKGVLDLLKRMRSYSSRIVGLGVLQAELSRKDVLSAGREKKLTPNCPRDD